MGRLSTRSVVAALAALVAGPLMLGAPASLAAQEGPLPYPVSTLHIVVPYAPGGGVDTLARAVAQYLPRYLKASVVVENWSGAGTRTGAARFQRVEPDGSYVFMNAEPTTILGQLLFGGRYDVQTWKPIYAFSSDQFFLAVRENSGYRSVADLLEASRARRVLFATSGLGSAFHLQATLFRARTGANFVQVPFDGTSTAFGALLGGTVDFTMGNIQNFFQYQGIRGLAIFADQRDPRVPDMPTLRELGYDVPPVLTTRGVYGPPHLPPAIVETLAAALARVAADADFINLANRAGFVLEPLDSAAYSRRIAQLMAMVNEAAPLMKAELAQR